MRRPGSGGPAAPGRLAEAAGAAVGGAALGGAVTWPLGLGAVGAAVGGLNGAISGWRGTYGWTTRRGVAAFALDSTWALVTTTSGVLMHGVNLVRGDPGYAPELSRRANRHVNRRGFQMRRGFAITWGNVVNGAGEIDGGEARAVRRRRLVTDHEDVHVWQARAVGPLYPVVYLGWMVLGSAAGAVRWLVVRPRTWSLAASMDAWGYYANPFEWWAYSRDGNWPPGGLGDRRALVWKHPMVRSIAARRAALTADADAPAEAPAGADPVAGQVAELPNGQVGGQVAELPNGQVGGPATGRSNGQVGGQVAGTEP